MGGCQCISYGRYSLPRKVLWPAELHVSTQNYIFITVCVCDVLQLCFYLCFSS